jgi:hypothetical protein
VVQWLVGTPCCYANMGLGCGAMVGRDIVFICKYVEGYICKYVCEERCLTSLSWISSIINGI